MVNDTTTAVSVIKAVTPLMMMDQNSAGLFAANAVKSPNIAVP
jgi:hypothetical protein